VAIGQRELIKSSGTNSVNISSKATEPTAGRDLNTRTGYRKIPNMSRRNWKPGFFCRTSFATIVCNLIRNTLLGDLWPGTSQPRVDTLGYLRMSFGTGGRYFLISKGSALLALCVFSE
jgi:hypothetical protein